MTDSSSTPCPAPCELSDVRWAPAPRHVTELEVATLERCLRRWRQEMEQDVRGMMGDAKVCDLGTGYGIRGMGFGVWDARYRLRDGGGGGY